MRLSLALQELSFMPRKEQIDFKNLATVPIDVCKIILQEQAREKEKRGMAQYSVQLTIIKIVREWKTKCGQ